jgi:hypothetical protein
MPRDQRLLTGRVVRVTAVGFATAGIVAACQAGADRDHAEVAAPSGLRVERVATSAQLPFSLFPRFGLLGDDSVCMLDRYEVELVCGTRTWRNVSRVAREGRGPGEVSESARLVRAPEAGLAVYDPGNRRLSFIGQDRRLTRSIPVDASLTPVGALSRDSVLMGLAQPFPSTFPTQEVRRVDTRSGETLAPVVLRFDPAVLNVDTAIMVDGVRAPDGRLLVRVGANGRLALAWYRADGAFEGLLSLPHYAPVFPTDRDVQQHMEEYRLIFRRPPPESEVRRFRERPLGLVRRSAARHVIQVDSAGRVWLLSTRPSETGTYVELFAGTEHIGALHLEGRVRAFQIAGSELAALVEPMEPDADGLYPQRLDWYRIVENPQGRPDDDAGRPRADRP